MRHSLWAWIALLGLADVAITCWGLANGWIYEANPLMAYLFEQGTLWAVSYAVFANVVLVYLVHTARYAFWWVIPAMWVLFGFKILAMLTHAYWMVGVFL